MSANSTSPSIVLSRQDGYGIRSFTQCFYPMGFKRTQSDHGLYIFQRDDIRIFLPVFVDDLTLAGKKGTNFDSFIEELSSHFKLCHLGPTTQLLGLDIHRDHANLTLSISQRQFITNFLQDHGLQDCKPVSTPLNPGCCLSTSICPQTETEALEMSQLLLYLLNLLCRVVALALMFVAARRATLPPSLIRSYSLVRLIFAAVGRTFSLSLNPLTAGV